MGAPQAAVPRRCPPASPLLCSPHHLPAAAPSFYSPTSSLQPRRYPSAMSSLCSQGITLQPRRSISTPDRFSHNKPAFPNDPSALSGRSSPGGRPTCTANRLSAAARPAILPESACPTTLVPLPALLSLLLRPRRTGLVAPHPRVHALAQHAPLTLNHNSHARLHTRLTAPRQPPLSCPAPSPPPPEPPPGPDRDRTRHKKTPAPLKVRASVLPNNRRITSRSSRHSPWRPSERPDRRCRRGSSSRPKR